MTFAEEWKLDSGLRETMDLEIHMAYFATSADYQGGRVILLFLTGSDETGEPVEIRMSAGADWSSQDGGKTIVHPTKKRINKNCIYGHFINAAIECEDNVGGQFLRDVLFSRGTPTTADIWTGIKMHLDLTEIKFGKNVDPQERLLPTHFLGLSTESAPALPTPGVPAPPVATVPPTPPAAPPVPPVAPPVPPVAPVAAPPIQPTLTPAEIVAQAQAQAAATQNGGSPLYTEMMELARASATYGDFTAAAFARNDVLADEELAIQVADEVNGIWPMVKS